MPSIFSKEKDENNLRYYRKMLTYYCFFIAFIVLGFLYFYSDLLALVAKNKEYQGGFSVVPVLALSFMVMGMNYFVGVGLYLKEKMIYFLVPSFTAAATNIFLNFLLIPRMGMMGAAFSNLAANIIYTALLTIISSKFIKVSFEWSKIFMIYLIAIVLYSVDILTRGLPFVAEITIKLVLLAIFPLVLYKLNFFEKIEIKRIKEGLSRVFDQYIPW